MLNCRSGSAIVKQEGKRLIIIVAVAVLLVPGLVQRDCGGNPGPNRNRKESACTAPSSEGLQ